MTARVKPIPFSGPMVRALLDGRKTQTRRLLKPQPDAHITGAGRYGSTEADGFWKDEWSWLSGDQTDIDCVEFEGKFKTGYIEGDLLWVREAWRVPQHFDDRPPANLPKGEIIPRLYLADGERKFWHHADPDGRFRQGMHIPRTFSRLTLRVTEVRVQRVQEISEADAEAEGVEPCARRVVGLPGGCDSYICGFQQVWHDLNAKRAPWSSNPWVVAVSFEVIKANVGRVLKEAA